MIFHLGKGDVQQDQKTAFEWFHKAATQNLCKSFRHFLS
jgi:TPR repeat protein